MAIKIIDLSERRLIRDILKASAAVQQSLRELSYVLASLPPAERQKALMKFCGVANDDQDSR